MKRTIKLTVLTLALSMVSVAAFAQTSVSTTNAADNISAAVVANCRISNFALAFGNYDPTSTTDTDASTTFDVRCTRGTNASIALDLGVNDDGTNRRLTDGTEFLTYGLFSDAGRTSAWTTAAPLAYVAASNAVATQTIYGRIPAEQDVLVGNYFDTVQATINF